MGLGWSYYVDKRILMIPGPTELHPRVVKALQGHIYPHYGEEWGRIYGEAVEYARRIINARRGELHIIHGPATLGLEMGLTNLLQRGDKAVALVTGFFSSRLAEVSRFCGAEVTTLRAEMGRVIPPEELKETLEQLKDVKLVMMVHSETTTATLSPIEEYSRIAKEHGALTLVDAISSFGGVAIDFNDAKLDCLVGSSNKCLNSIPGATPIAFSDEALEHVKKRSTKPFTWYTNLEVWRKYIDMWGDMGHPYPATVNTYSILAFREAAEAAVEEGMRERHERHVKVAQAVRKALRAMGFRTVADEGSASPTVTSAFIPEEVGGRLDELLEVMKKRFRIFIGSGVDENEKDIIRIGHMGVTASIQYLAPTLSALVKTLRALGYSAPDGASEFVKTLNESI